MTLAELLEEQRQLDALGEATEELAAEIASRSTEIATTTERLAAARTDEAAAQAAVDAALAARAEFDATSRELESANQEHVRTAAGIAELEARIAELEALQPERSPEARELRRLRALRAEQQRRADENAARRMQLERHLASLAPRFAALADLQRVLEAAGAASASVETDLLRLEARLARATRELAGTRARLATLTRAHSAHLVGLFGQLSFDTPILLLPVRLETRFSSPTELLVRVYPDDVHQDTHEPALTEQEEAWGRDFWAGVCAAGVSQDRDGTRFALWQALAGKFGSARAAWIAAALQPTNIAEWRADPTRPPSFPPAPGGRTGSWTRAACARCLPDRWLVLGYVGPERVVEQWGRLIVEPLPTGPDPAATADEDGVDAGMLWMVDFASAEEVGMGVRVALPARARAGLDLLLVVGVRATRSPSESADDLVDLLRAHQHTWTLDVVEQGAPTNNTEDTRSGFDARDQDHERTFHTAVLPLVDGRSAVDPEADVAILARALGVPAATFATIGHRELRDQHDAELMQHLLWPATWGYFLREGFSWALREGGVDLDRWRAFCTRYVRARGPLPPLRIGRQPYGVLPVTSLDAWQPLEPEPEVVLVVAPRGGRELSYTLGWDLEDDGQVAGGWAALQPVPQAGTTIEVFGAALARVPEQRFPDLFVVSADVAGSLQVSVVHTLEADGRFTGGAALPADVPGRAGEPVLAASLSVAPLFGPESRDVIVLRMVGAGARERTPTMLLTIGRNVDREGTPLDGWMRAIGVPASPGGRTIDVAVAADDLDGDGLVEVVVAALVDSGQGVEVRLVVGSGLQSDAPSWTPPATLQFAEVMFSQCRALDLSFFRADASRAPSALLTIVAGDTAGPVAWTWRKRTFSRRDVQGNWQRLAPAPELPPGTDCVAVDGWDLGRRSSLPLQGSDVSLVNLLTNLRALWRAAVPALPSYAAAASAGAAADPDANLLTSLALTPLGEDLAVRPALGPTYLEDLLRVAQAPPAAGFLDPTTAALEADLRLLGLDELLETPPDERVRWTSLRLTPEHVQVTEPWVQHGTNAAAPLAAPLAGARNYPQWLATAPPAEIHDQNLPADVDPSVLFRLLRHALLQEYSDAARARETGSTFPSAGSREPEIVDPPVIVENAIREGRTRTATRILSDPLVAYGEPAGDVLHREVMAGTAPPALQQSVMALKELATRRVDVLARLTQEALDVGSHRLDAWITAVATRRLLERRQHAPGGIHVGGFGWIERLTPRGTRPLSDGFVHAPSLNHAATAAILRAGYESHRGDGTADQLAIDLSSRRTRAALRLLDGVGAGESLGALLGYDFERSLHEAHPGLELDVYIDVFREQYPLVAGKLTAAASADADATAEQLAGRSVVDGMTLVRRYQQGKASDWGPDTVDWTALFGLGGAPPGGFPARYPASGAAPAELEYNAVATTIESLEDTLDAVADLLLAESVFQQVQGNFLRAGASLDALSRGEGPPAELDVLRTPRSGQAVTHLAVVTIGAGLDVDRAAAAAWLDEQQLAAGASPRALAEPRLNHWVAQLLPDPSRVACEIRYANADGTTQSAPPRTVRLTDLGVGPLDVLSWMHDGSTAGLGDLERRVVLADGGAEIDDGARRVLDLSRTERFAPEDVSLEELFEMTRAIRGLLADARPLQPSDLATLGAAAAIDLDDLQARSDVAVDGFLDAASVLDADLDALDGDALIEILAALAGYGVSGAYPISGPADVDALRGQLRSVELRARATRERLTQLIAGAPTAGARPDAHVDHLVALLQTVFGEGFMVLPVLTAGAAHLEGAFTARDRAEDVSRDELEAWLRRVAHVRRPLHAFENVMLFAEAVGAEDALNLRAAQSVPTGASDDVWVGAALAGGSSSRFAGRTSWVVHVASEGAKEDTLCGLHLDRWVEVIPSPMETTGVAFHCDAPQATAPQSLLLAVPPNPRAPWDAGTLEAILLETLDLARLRLVDSERRATFGHLLPALLLARNVGDGGRGDTIATNYGAR